MTQGSRHFAGINSLQATKCQRRGFRRDPRSISGAYARADAPLRLPAPAACSTAPRAASHNAPSTTYHLKCGKWQMGRALLSYVCLLCLPALVLSGAVPATPARMSGIKLTYFDIEGVAEKVRARLCVCPHVRVSPTLRWFCPGALHADAAHTLSG